MSETDSNLYADALGEFPDANPDVLKALADARQAFLEEEAARRESATAEEDADFPRDEHGWCAACGGTGEGDSEVYPDGEVRRYRCDACGGSQSGPCHPSATWSPLHPANPTGREMRPSHQLALEVQVSAPPQTEEQKRDAALELLAQTRARLVELGGAVAAEICSAKGRVTSVEVAAELRARGYGSMLDSVDGRWLGTLFRRGWRRQGYEPTGSHARPVAIWTR